MIAVPSIFIVAPSGIVNDAILSLTPNLFFIHCNVIGMVALLLDVENENNSASLIP